MTIRLAVIGLGKMGLFHLSIANALDDFEVAAICDNSRLTTDIVGKFTRLKGFDAYAQVLKLPDLNAHLNVFRRATLSYFCQTADFTLPIAISSVDAAENLIA